MIHDQCGRAICPNCQNKIVPRLTFENGEPRASWCPLCGKKVDDFFDTSVVSLAVVVVICVVCFFIYY
jgi:hypothetical protein